MMFRGVNHLALVSSDMNRTVQFYTQVLGLRLVRAQRNDDDPSSRHYFFDLGGGNLLAFFDFPGSRPGQVGTGPMHHVAFSVESGEKLEELRQQLRRKGVEVSPIVDHDFIRSIYFRDPDGILLEASAYTRTLTEADIWADPDPVPAAAALRPTSR
ncbi:MAG: VOC family protein [Thermodesulfobacteriota bacterium]|jgi:catechol 2,3-dioxygenase-like lactoylglutathione lyase family enzyme